MVTVLLFWGTNMADVTSWEIAFYLSDFSRADWSRTMVNKSAGRGTDVMVALFIFLFLARNFNGDRSQKLSMLL